MSRSSRALWGAAIAAMAALALPSLASAATTCVFATVGLTPTLSVNHSDGISDVTIRRVPLPADPTQATIEVFEGATNLTCTGGPVSVTQVDTIAYDNSGGISDLILVEPDTFVPGFTSEGGAAVSEIETTVANTGGILSDVVLRDGDGVADRYVFGTAPGANGNGVNVNTDDPVPDADVTLVAPFFQDFVAEGGAGADTFTSAGGEGTGGPYARGVTMNGGPGADTLIGGPGRDAFRNDPGDDLIDGGAGDDEVDYSASTLPVDIDLQRSGPQNGGSLGRDTLTSIEEIEGSDLNDVLRGTAAANTIFGLDGNDLIEGRGGDDFLGGDEGTDTVSYEGVGAPVAVDLAVTTPQATGGGGTDRFYTPFENLIGGPGTDVLRGTAGPNTIEGRAGVDTVLALEGDDTVLVRDGIPDTADCGPGNDRASVDPGGIDVTIGCESVTAGVAVGVAGLPGAPGTAGPGSPARRRVSASLKGPRSQKLVRGAVRLRLACPALSCAARATASTRLRLRAGTPKRTIGLLPARARIAAGKSRLLRLKLAPGGLGKVRAALAAGREPVVKVTVVVTDAAAATRTLRRAITLLP